MIPSPLAGARVLVTGASGFIGSHLCRRLRQEGSEVHAVSRQGGEGVRDRLRWWRGDLSEMGTVWRVLSEVRPELIFHLASHVAGAREVGLVLPTFQSNLMSTVNVLTGAREIGCGRILLTGSMEEPDPDDAEAVPVSPYAAAKWAAAGYARMFRALYNLPVVLLRVFMVYGPAQRDLRKLIPYVTLSLLRREAPKLTSGGRPVDWIYVEDVVEALLAAAQAPGIDGRRIDVGSGTLVPIRTVVQRLVDLVGSGVEPQFGALPERPLEQVRAADRAGSLATIGWQSTTSLEEGLTRTVEWYRAHVRDASSVSDAVLRP